MTDVPPLLLAIDDEPAILTIVERFGRQMGFEVETRTNPAAPLAEFSKLDPDVAVVDLQMPELGGLDVLKAIRAANPECHVILLTGNPTIDSAIEAVKLGARDYLQKPIDFGRLGRLLSDVIDGMRRRERLLRVEADVAGDFECEGMIGRSTVMQELFDSLRRYAPHMRTVLVMGEAGTGKELVAKALHRLGPRKAKRFIMVNCSAVVESLFESELFGHARGAFTGAVDAKVGLFEHADGGTLFLDEAGELPQSVQAKLLRAVDLTARFIRECAARVNRPITGLTQSAERLLFNAPWPGNIRELRNVLERSCILSEAGMITERDLASALTTKSATLGGDADEPSDDRLSTLQRRQVERVLEETGGNESEAARRLGISRRALYRRIDEMNLAE